MTNALCFWRRWRDAGASLYHSPPPVVASLDDALLSVSVVILRRPRRWRPPNGSGPSPRESGKGRPV